MRRRNRWALAAGVLLLVMGSGCTQERDAGQPQGQANAQATQDAGEGEATNDAAMMALRADCPVVDEDVRVDSTDTEEGIALVFETESGDVADLQRRVRATAARYGIHGGQRWMAWHHMGRGGMVAGPVPVPGMMGGSGKGLMHQHDPMPEADATVEETENGARIVLTPTDKDQLQALREHVRGHAQRMQNGECWVLQDMAPTPDAS